jgi:hypothetical protein
VLSIILPKLIVYLLHNIWQMLNNTLEIFKLNITPFTHVVVYGTHPLQLPHDIDIFICVPLGPTKVS